MSKVLCVLGTRPEVIKMAPVVKALRRQNTEAPILATAQHRGLLDQMLTSSCLEATWDLDAMRSGQNLAELTRRLVPTLEALYRESGAISLSESHSL